MGLAALLKARHVGIRDLKDHLSEYLTDKKPLVATDHGQPSYYLIPYHEMVELAEILEELSDPDLVAKVRKGREEYRKGSWVPLIAMERPATYGHRRNKSR